MKGLLLALLLTGASFAAQDQKVEPAKAEPVQKLFVLKYADPDQVINLIRVFAMNVTPNTEMHALAVSATPSSMAAIEEAIKKLDVPSAVPQNIELTVYLLAGDDGASGSQGAIAGPLPKELEGVVGQLKNTFAYKRYSLWDVLTMRTRSGQEVTTTSSGGGVQIGGVTQPVLTQFRLRSATIAPDGVIHITGLRSSQRVPTSTGGPGQFTYTDLGMNTDLDLKEGQKVVVGKQSMGPNQALFLVLVARVAQ